MRFTLFMSLSSPLAPESLGRVGVEDGGR